MYFNIFRKPIRSYILATILVSVFASSVFFIFKDHNLIHKDPKISDTSAGWRKYDHNPVLGGNLGTIFDICLIKETGRYKMWCSWRPQKGIAYSESVDGINWSIPKLVLGPNSTSDWEQEVNRPVVVKRQDGYHMWYTGQVNTKNQKGFSRIGYATSLDGKTWIRTRNLAVISPDQTWEKIAVMCPHVLWDSTNREYHMWYSAGDQYEPDAIGYATSIDGITWKKYNQNPIFKSENSKEWEKAKVTACQIIKQNGWFIMFYIGFRDIAHASIGIARSRDGVHKWERHPQNPVIRSGNGWDSDAVYKPYALLNGNRWMLWYNGRRSTDEQIGLAFHDGINLGFK